MASSACALDSTAKASVACSKVRFSLVALPVGRVTAIAVVVIAVLLALIFLALLLLLLLILGTVLRHGQVLRRLKLILSLSISLLILVLVAAGVAVVAAGVGDNGSSWLGYRRLAGNAADRGHGQNRKNYCEPTPCHREDASHSCPYLPDSSRWRTVPRSPMSCNGTNRVALAKRQCREDGQSHWRERGAADQRRAANTAEMTDRQSDMSRLPLRRLFVGPWARACLLALGVALLSTRLLAGGGYLLTLDSTFGPRPAVVSTGFYAPVAVILDVLNRLIGGAATGRLYLLLAVWLAAFCPMVLLRRLPWYAQCCAGLLGALNPWVYDHLAIGQWGVVVAAALLSLWLAAWATLQGGPGLGPAIRLVAVSVSIAAFSANFIGILAVLAAAAFVASRTWRFPARRRWALLAGLGTAVVLAYGVVPFFLGNGAASYGGVQAFGRADFVAFASTPDPTFGLLDLVGLYGHWTERLGQYPLATDGVTWWLVPVFLLVLLALVGAVLTPRRWLLIPGAVGLLLSASTATGIGLSAFLTLSEHLPLVGVYREPDKWNSLWLVALVILAAEGVAALAATMSSLRRDLVAVTSALAVALATLLPAGSTQIRELPAVLQPAQYPVDWYAAADWMATNISPDDQVAVLPWHLYQSYPFTQGRLVANPAGVFFPGRLLTAQDPELLGTAADPGPYGIGTAAAALPQSGCALASALRAGGVRWVVVESGLADTSTSAQALMGCGYTAVEGQSGQTQVLRLAS